MLSILGDLGLGTKLPVLQANLLAQLIGTIVAGLALVAKVALAWQQQSATQSVGRQGSGGVAAEMAAQPTVAAALPWGVRCGVLGIVAWFPRVLLHLDWWVTLLCPGGAFVFCYPGQNFTW